MPLIVRADGTAPPLRSARPVQVSSRGVCVVIVAVLCVIHVIQPDGWVGQFTYLTVTIGASVVAWLSVRRGGASSRVWLAIGISASALGDVLYEAYVAVKDTVPDVSIADVAVDRVVPRRWRRHAPVAAPWPPPQPPRHRRSDRHGGDRPHRSAHPVAVLDLRERQRHQRAVVRAERLGVLPDPRRDSPRGRAQDAPRAPIELDDGDASRRRRASAG